jgi:NAD(P)-dependent dehydrogenase (short-subunit alcohol dehydrogenase family)
MSPTGSPCVLVVGATGGLGPAVVAELLASRFTVHFTGRDAGRLQALASVHTAARGHVLDAGDAAATRSLIETIDAEAPLGAYVHLAGGYRDGKPIEDLEDDDWLPMRDANWTSLRHGASSAYRAMRARGGGSIVTMGSNMAIEGGVAVAPYAVTKAAVLAFTRCLAAEGRSFGVRANCVIPSIIDTASNRAAMPESARRGWVSPKRVARVIAYLCGEASEAVTGSILTLRGR